MTKATRTVTYTLTSRTSGVAGLQKFEDSLKRILDVQNRLAAQGDVTAGLRAQAQAAIQAAQQDARATQSTVRVKKAAENEYTTYLKAQKREQEQAERKAQQEAVRAAKEAAQQKRAADNEYRAFWTRSLREQERAEKAAALAKVQAGRDAVQALVNEQAAQRNLMQAGKLTGMALVSAQQDIQRRALEAANAVSKTSNEYRKLTQVAAAAQRTQDSVLGNITQGSLAAGVRSGIQGSGLFNQLTSLTGGPSAASLGIIAGGFQSAQSAALGFAGATSGAAVAAGALGAASAGAGVALAGLAAGTVNAGRVAATFEATMDAAKVSTGGTAEQMKALEGAAMNMGKGLGFGAREAARGIEELGSQGLNAQQALDGGLIASMTLARATTGDLTQAAQISAGALNAWKLQANQLPDVADTISAAVNNTTLRMDNLRDGIAAGGAVAKSFGVDFRGYVAMLSLGTDAMLSASDAGTSLKSMFMALTPNSKESAALMKELKFSAFDAQGQFIGMEAVVRKLTAATRNLTPEQRAMKLETIFGSDAVRIINILLDQGAAKLRERTDLLNKSGEAQRSAKEKMDNAIGATLEWNRATEKLQIAWASGLLPVFTKFLNEVATPLIDQTGAFVEKLNQIKSPGEIKAFLKIEASDDATTKILKFIFGIGEGTKDWLTDQNPILKAGAAAAAVLARVQGTDDPNAADLTLTRINPLKGQGPLLPGQTREGQLTLADLNRLDLDKKAAAFFGAIFRQESGGKYDAFNTDYRKGGQGALGKYQVMPQNILGLGWDVPQSQRGAWALKNLDSMGVKGKGWDFDVLGKDITPRQFLNSPQYQEAISQARMSANLQKRLMEAGGDLEKAVKEAAKDWYGRVAPAKGPTPDAYAASIWARFQAEAAGGATMPKAPPAGGTPGTPGREASDQQLIAEARRIVGKLNGYTDAGNLTMQTAAEKTLKAFEDRGPRAAAAVKFVRDELSQAGKEVGKFGQGYDKLNAQLTQAETLYKISDDARAYTKSLDAVAVSAQQAAKAERDRNGQTDKYAALLALAGDATSKARQVREADSRAAEQDAKEAERRTKEQAALRARIADERRQMTIQEASDALNRTKTLAAAELAAFKGTSAQRLALIERQARDEEAARVRVAAATRAKALADARNGEAQLRAGREQAANRAYDQAVLEAGGARDEAIRQAKEKEAAAVRQLRGEYSQLADSIREQGAAGTFDAEAKQKAVKAFNSLGRAAAEAGLSTDQYITGARRSVWALVQGAEAATERLNLLDLGGAIIDPKTGKLLYKTDEQVRGIGVAAEDAADDYYDLGEAISNVGLFSKTELTDLVTKSGLAADEAERLLAAWDALYGEMDSGPLAPDNLQGRGANNPSSDDPATGALIEGEAEQLAAAFWKSSGEQLQGVLDGLKNQDSPLAELLKGSIAAKDLISRIELETDPAQLQGLAQEVADFLDSSVGKRLPPTVRDALTAAVQGATDYQDTLAQATGDAVTDGFDRAGKADPAPTNKFGEYMKTLIGDSIDLADPEQLRGVTEELDRARTAGELTAAEFRLLHLLIDSINGSGGLDIPVNVDDQRLEQYNQQLTDLEARYRAGEISGEEFAAEAERLIPLLERLAEAAALAGKPELAAAYHAAAAGLREMSAELLKLQKFAQGFQKFTQGLGSIFGAFGASGAAALANGIGDAVNEASKLPKLFKDAKDAWGALQKGGGIGAVGDLLGSIGGIAGVVGAALNVAMQIGNLIEDNNASIQKWKKAHAELAAETRQAAGSKQLNGWLDNPYYADLSADADARDRMANSKWYQRAWWSFSGTGPKTMSDDLAKLKIKAAEIFSQFGGDLANTLEESLMEGFDQGDFSKVNDKLDGMINKFVARMTVQMVLANSKLKDLIKAYADARAAGGDGTAELAAIRQEVEAVTGIAQGALTGLDGFGAGADGSAPGQSAANPVTGANFYIANSSKIDLFDGAVTRWDALTLRHGTSLDRHSTTLDRHSDMLDRLMRDGITLRDEAGNTRAAFR